MTLSTWAHQSDADPAGDLAPGMALLNQANALAATFSNAAGIHQTVKLAISEGSFGPNQSALDLNAAPAQALQIVASGQVDSRTLPGGD